MAAAPPLVLCLSGHDPTGGAGIQADVETIAALGGYALSVITCLTVQDTSNVQRILPQRPSDFLEQAQVLLADVRPAACKIGLIGSLELVEAIAALLESHADLPVVLDPVLEAGGGMPLADSALCERLRRRLFPRVTLLTPNGPEARALSGAAKEEDAVRHLLEDGCQFVLLTGGHDEERPEIVNTLYGKGGLRQTRRWPRLPHVYHGSGCTLAAACAVFLARGLSVPLAVERAQAFVAASLSRGFRPGRGQYLPRRIAEFSS